MSIIYHEGELAVQERAGVRETAVRVGRGIKATMPPAAISFLQEQPFVILAAADDKAQLWASILMGKPSFMNPLDDHTLQINALPAAGDPLFAHLSTGSQVGLVAIEFESRRRMRVNGIVELHSDTLLVHAEQVYANCPKYIQTHPVLKRSHMGKAITGAMTRQLSAAQIQWIREANTFFIASAHPSRGVDASHRGGNSGFVHVVDRTRIIWPDYVGNTMFNTLGNIAVNSHAGLLFLDFERSRILQLTGHAEIVWDEEKIVQYAGAERLLMFETEQVIETKL